MGPQPVGAMSAIHFWCVVKPKVQEWTGVFKMLFNNEIKMKGSTRVALLPRTGRAVICSLLMWWGGAATRRGCRK